LETCQVFGIEPNLTGGFFRIELRPDRFWKPVRSLVWYRTKADRRIFRIELRPDRFWKPVRSLVWYRTKPDRRIFRIELRPDRFWKPVRSILPGGFLE